MCKQIQDKKREGGVPPQLVNFSYAGEFLYFSLGTCITRIQEIKLIVLIVFTDLKASQLMFLTALVF